MTALIINNFGGEVPRTPARTLPPGGAQRNHNLLATATEFRPLLDDTVVGSAPLGSQTLYRLSKDAAGTTRTGDGDGWLADTASKNYVKGQINDDGTERTYFTFNDATAPPRALDALGADRVMGVPAPFYASAAIVVGPSFTMTDATAWADATLAPAIYKAIKDAMTAPSRTQAGAYGLHGLTQDAANPSLANYTVYLDNPNSAGLKDPTLGGTVSTGANIISPLDVSGNTPASYQILTIPLMCLPSWGAVGNTTGLATALRMIETPQDGAQVFNDLQITDIVNTIVAHFDANGEAVTALRTALDVQVTAFVGAIEFVLTPSAQAPTAPQKPVVPEYDYTDSPTRHPDWIAYDLALSAYAEAAKTAASKASTTANEKTAKVAAIVTAKASAAKLVAEIDALYLKRTDTLLTWVKEKLEARGLAKTDTNPGGIVKVDAERLLDTRFYIATFVNDWGEESAPTAPTALLTVDQYSSVTVTVAPPPSGRNLVGWRIYRSAHSNSNIDPPLAVTDLDPAKAMQTGGAFDYYPLRATSYSDANKSEALGETCPTLTWLEPPYRMQTGSARPVPPKGSDPYLRGLVGMPNGIMAGFVDNTVAFCDPYHPYAWPVEYQIPLKYPVVGLGVFGQSLFVGTVANPSIISGADSASMSEQILDDAQACLSAKSIVAMNGGVLYASPDGICFASSNGVQVLTSNLFAREDWQALKPGSIMAAAHEGIYYFWYSGLYGGVLGGCLALDTVAKKLTRVDAQASAVFTDRITDAVFYVSGTQIKRAFAAGRRTGVWKSGLLAMPAQAPLAWLQVDGDQSPSKPATVRWYGDGELRHTAVVTSTTPTRLPAGRWLEHEVEVESQARITRIALAGDTQRLQQL